MNDLEHVSYKLYLYSSAVSWLKPSLHEPQLQVEWSVTFLYSLVVERIRTY